MSNSRQVTLQEIAASIGAPLEQITKVILGQPGVSDEFRRQVFAALEEAGIVRMSGAPTQGTIGIVIPGTVIGDYIGEVVRSASERAKERGYSLVLNVENATKDEDLVRLISSGCDGMIAVVPNRYQRLLELCYEYGREHVLVDYQGDDELDSAITVQVNNRESIIKMMQHLFDLGHRRIAFIIGNTLIASARQRLEGYRAALEQAGIPYDPALVVEGDWFHPSGYAATSQLLRLNTLPTAIVASNDLMAFGAIQAVREAGLRVGSDISITGFDDIKMAATVSPPLTTMRQPMKVMGESAANMLIDRLQGKTLPERHVSFDTELIVRESTGRAPS